MPPTLLSPTWPQWGGEPSVRGSGTHTGALDSSASGLPGIKPPAPGILVALPPCTLPWRFLPTLLLPSCSPRTAFQGCLQGPTEQQLCNAASWEWVPSPFSTLALTIEQCAQSPGRACIWITEDEPSRQQKGNEQPMNSDFILFTQKMLWSSDLNSWQDSPAVLSEFKDTKENL